MQQPVDENRLHAIETRLAALESRMNVMDDRDMALLRATDDVREGQRRLERDMERGFAQIMTTQQEQAKTLKEHSKALQEQRNRLDRIESTLETLVEVAKDHKAAIEQIAHGQEQIISLLRGQARTND